MSEKTPVHADPEVGNIARKLMDEKLASILGKTGTERDCDCGAIKGKCRCESPSKVTAFVSEAIGAPTFNLNLNGVVAGLRK